MIVQSKTSSLFRMMLVWFFDQKKLKKIKLKMTKKDTVYPVVEPVPTGSGTGSRNLGPGSTGTGTGSHIPGAGPTGTGTGTGSSKTDRVPSCAEP